MCRSVIFSWTQYMNHALTASDPCAAGSTTTFDNWMRAFDAQTTTSLNEVDLTTAVSCPSLTTISVSDLDQLQSVDAPACCGRSPAGLADQRPAVPESTSAGEQRQRLSGLPLKHRYKQTSRNQSATSYRPAV